ncbi:MAG TPA: peptidyl-prolyl cis-trans isomerase [Steroidobacteraceae bacterium]|nr:peptidyl-prolyl cis-trans isomerase [Steroidobacteraceae bacterium]
MAFFSLGALLGLAIAGYGLFTAKGTRSHAVPPEDVALVNNRPILRSDFMTQVQAQFATPFAESTPQQRKSVLDDMLAEELQVQRGLEIDLPNFDPDVRTAMVAGVQLEITADVMAQQPTDEQLRRYYEANKGKYVIDGVLRMRDLVAKSGPATTTDQAMAAQQAVTALRAGMPPEPIMQRYRLEDSGALMDAGHVDTGEIFEFAAKAKLGPKVYAAAATLRSGQVSDPIGQSDGTHVIVMLEHRMPAQQDYAAAADKVWTDYKIDAQARVREANVRYLRSRADILLSTDARALEAPAR